MRKWPFCFVFLLLGLALAPSAHGALMTLQNTGWDVSWDDGFAGAISIHDLGSTTDQAYLALDLVFNDSFLSDTTLLAPLSITFIQNDSPAVSQMTIQMSVMNHTDYPIGAMALRLIGGGATFDADLINLGGSGGLNLSGFTGLLTPDNKQMYLLQGIVPAGQSYLLSSTAGVPVDAVPSTRGTNAYTFSVQPAAQLPEPAALTCLALGALLLLRRRGIPSANGQSLTKSV